MEWSAYNLAKAQERYKKNSDNRVKPLRKAVSGEWAYIIKEQPTKYGSGIARRHKLQSKGEGSYLVVASTEHIITIVGNDETIEVIMRDRASIPPNENVSNKMELIDKESESIHQGETVRARAETAAKGGVRILRRPTRSYIQDPKQIGNSDGTTGEVAFRSDGENQLADECLV